MIELVKFLLFIFFFLFLPGLLAIRKTKIKLGRTEEIFISLGLGIAILTFSSFVLSSAGLRFLLFPLLILADIYLVIFDYRPKSLRLKKLKIDWLVVLLIFSATIFQSLLMIKSGTNYQKGFAFWGVHGHDGIWHLTLAQELANNFPAQNPGFAGEKLKNYHFFFDLLVAEIFRLTRVPLMNLYFQFFPILLSLILNSLVFFFASRWSGKRNVGLLAVFFTAFASSFGHLLPFFGKGSDNWETAFWAMQPHSSLVNPPFAISLLLLVLGLDLLLVFYKKKKESIFLGAILVLIFGTLVEFKVYAGFLALAGLGLAGIYNFLKEKKLFLFVIALLSSILSFILYFSQNKVGASFFIWQPLWFVRTMIQAPDRVNWVTLELRRQVYVAWRNRRGVWAVDLLSLAIFVVGNLGTRIFGVFWVFTKGKKEGIIETFLVTVFLIGFAIPIFYLQKFVVWNSIQFVYYSIFVASFFAAWFIADCLELLGKLKYLLIVVLIALSVPPSLKTTSWHLGAVPASVLDKDEKSALEFLRNLSVTKSGVVLVYPQSPSGYAKIAPPVPLSYYSAAYVSFFSGKKVFLEDETAALIQGYDFEKRISQERRFFSEKNSNLAYQFLQDNKIHYIYLVDNQSWEANLETRVHQIYKNPRVRIFEFND